MTTLDLFDDEDAPRTEAIGPASCVLRGFARAQVPALLSGIAAVQAVSPTRHMVTPGGFTMSVATTNCGALGWTSDRSAYRYTARDPVTGQPWPAMPELFAQLARDAAEAAGFAAFAPDACLVNHYVPGTRLSLHQDRDERDFGAPIVSVSLGMAARFQFGGLQRGDKAHTIVLRHGDVVVWGGVDRLRYHGVLPLKGEAHPLLGPLRINLTFRQAG